MANAVSAGSSSSAANGPILAAGDWTKDLIQLAKTAELKKHALTLQLHTAQILSAHASLDQKSKAIEDLKEQKNKFSPHSSPCQLAPLTAHPRRLESERTRLLNCLLELNQDRDKADLLEATLSKECTDLRQKIQTITDGEYSVAKQDVDRLRQELGQPPLPSLQETLEEKSTQYLKELRLQTEKAANKRGAPDELGPDGQPVGKRPRGRPKGSKTTKHKGKESAQTAASTSANASAPVPS
ncbi:uncharacterized protein FIBRA_00772 [Fibroporia radiculosa]|uniref:Uncharacterized protein n=1 Tax=Fibroporia radiculosa TaxID=599839 RepID=J4HS61_9APHY|nr:uncharacterized protein FIBRA_00772 [Fibroporia radiculosa]CCL98767.1 predicted protein [Fibroporia radiculosa]